MEQTLFVKKLIEKTKQNVKTIVLPEGEDERVLKAAHEVAQIKAAKLIILGNEAEIKS